MASPEKSDCLLARMDKSEVAMFRFLLEAHENLAFFTVLEKQPALIKVIFAPESREEVITALADIGRSVKLEWEDWPLERPRSPH